MDTNKADTSIERKAIRNVGVNTIFRELKMNPGIVERLRVKFGLKFRNEGCRYYYNLSEVASSYLNAPTKWKLRIVKDACERYLNKIDENRRYFRQYRKQRSMEKELELAISEKNRLEQQNAKQYNDDKLDALRRDVAVLWNDVAAIKEKQTLSKTEKVESLDGHELSDAEKGVIRILRRCKVETMWNGPFVYLEGQKTLTTCNAGVLFKFELGSKASEFGDLADDVIGEAEERREKGEPSW